MLYGVLITGRSSTAMADSILVSRLPASLFCCTTFLIRLLYNIPLIAALPYGDDFFVFVQLGCDFPVCNFTIRAGYLNSSYRTDVNGIQSHIISHSFMIGLVKEFISFGGKRLKNTQRFRSAYY